MKYNIEDYKSLCLLEEIPEERHENAANVINNLIEYLGSNYPIDDNENEISPIIVILKIFRELDISTEQAIEIVNEFKSFMPRNINNIPIDFIEYKLVKVFTENKINELKICYDKG